ncbi:Myb-like_DNA-binding domain-containing protein [Hexamita inflata]|uniref:Myb-like_DNA-binding domain-containing protein n=1 Tax=Hexamita inflata TaxID=28002 RepID=A0ABP1GKL8_9EUKA
MCVESYGKNWKRIQQEYFPSISANALHTKYFTLMQKQLEQQSLLQSLKNNPTQQISDKDELINAFDRLKIIKNRRDVLLGKTIQEPTEIDKAFGVEHVDELEKRYLQKQIVETNVDEMITLLEGILKKK